MKVESIAECSILHYIWPALSDNHYWNPIFGLLLEWSLKTGFTVLSLLPAISSSSISISSSGIGSIVLPRDERYLWYPIKTWPWPELPLLPSFPLLDLSLPTTISFTGRCNSGRILSSSAFLYSLALTTFMRNFCTAFLSIIRSLIAWSLLLTSSCCLAYSLFFILLCSFFNRFLDCATLSCCLLIVPMVNVCSLNHMSSCLPIWEAACFKWWRTVGSISLFRMNLSLCKSFAFILDTSIGSFIGLCKLMMVQLTNWC